MTEDPIVKCERCHETGFVFVEGINKAMRCECRREHALTIEIPPRFLSARLSDFPAERVDSVLAWLVDPIRAGGGILVTGKPGRGKTHFACALIRHFRELGKIATFTEADQLFEEIRDRFGTNARESEHDVLRTHIEPELPVLDDIGAGSLSDLERRYTLTVLKRKGDWLKPTIVTTNWSLPQLAECFDERLASRLGEYWHISFNNLPDRRQQR